MSDQSEVITLNTEPARHVSDVMHSMGLKQTRRRGREDISNDKQIDNKSDSKRNRVVCLTVIQMSFTFFVFIKSDANEKRNISMQTVVWKRIKF